MSETSALSQADGATTETPAQPTTLQELNQAIFDYGTASLNLEVAGDARAAAYTATADAEARMMALYKTFQTEQRNQGGAK